MSDTNVAPGNEGAAAPVVVTPADTTATYPDAHSAGRALAQARWKRENPTHAKDTKDSSVEPQSAPESAAAEPPTEDSAPEADSGPETVPAATEEVDPAEEPSIEPPRSWPKDKKDAFKLLPPDLQRDVAEVERSREATFLRRETEAAEKLKGLTAKEQAAEQIRQEYEKALPALMQALQSATAGEFADIKSQDDVDKLANEDWPRFARWQAHQMKVGAIQREAQAAQERQQSEYKTRWSEFAKSEDQKALDRIPELADKAKASKVADAALATLESVGFTRDEFAKAWMGEASISPRDHRWQQIVWKAAQYDQVKANTKPAPKTVPPVQRPGVSKAPTTAADAQLQTLEKAFERNPTIKNAVALKAARSRAA